MKLLKVNRLAWILFLIVILFLIGLGIFVTTIEFEQSFPTTVQVLQSNPPQLIVRSENIYQILESSNISLNINNSYYKTSIIDVQYDSNLMSYVIEVEIGNYTLIPNSFLPVNVIYHTNSIIGTLFN